MLARCLLHDDASAARRRELHEILTTALEDESIRPWQRDWIESAREALVDYEEHVCGLPEGLDAPGEWRALAELLRKTPEMWWANERLRATAPPDVELAEQVPPLQVEVTNPGAMLAAVIGIASRLELGSAPANRILAMLLEGMRDDFDHKYPDPLMSRIDAPRTTGVDMRRPWRWNAWSPATVAGWSGDGADIPLTAGVELPCENPEQLLGLFVRGSREDEHFAIAVQMGFGVAAMLPLAPGFLWAIWEEVRADVIGGDEYQGPEHEDRYLALVPEVEGETYRLTTLDVFRGGVPEWDQSFVHFADGVATLTHTGEILQVDALAPRSGGESGGLSITCDLASLAAQAALVEDGWERHLIAAGTRVHANLTFDGETVETRLALHGLPEAAVPVLSNVGVDGFSGPVDLIPATAHMFGGLRFDPAALSRWMLAESLRAAGDAGEKRDWKRALRLLVSLRGEAGFAALGMPDFEGDYEEAWSRRLIVYVSVDPEPVRAMFLEDDEMERVEAEDLELYLREDLLIAIVGDYLVLGDDEEVIRALGHDPFLAQNDAFRALRVPDDAAGVAFMDTELVATGLLELLPEGEDTSLVRLGITALRAAGPVHAWLRAAPNEIEGAVTLRPSMRPEAASDQVHRLVGYASHSAGSVRSGALAVGGNREDMRILHATLRLPEGRSLPSAWTGARIDGERASDGSYEITNRAGVPLPESSPVSLPIEDPALARFLRAEGVHGQDARPVRELAESIRDGETDPARIVRNVIAWVGEHIEYERTEDASSLDTLESLEADCSEFTDLTVTFCRALGIPARRVGGLALGSDSFIAHAWAEVYLDRWYEIDPTWDLAHVSAAHLRIPRADVVLLAQDPGVTLTPTLIEMTDDRRMSWHAAPNGFRDDECIPTVAAHGDSILLGLAGRSPSGEECAAAFVSRDGGLTFERTEDFAPEGERHQLLAAHGRLYRIELTTRGPVAFALDGSTPTWRATALPDAVLDASIPTGPHFFFAFDRSGFLALLPEPTDPRLFRLDPDLRLVEELELPEGRGYWKTGSAQQPVLALRNAKGTTLFEEEQGDWVAVSEPLDTLRFASLRMLVREETVEFTGWDRKEEGPARLSFDRGTRTSSVEPLSPESAGVRRARAAPFLWNVSLRDGGITLVREPLR